MEPITHCRFVWEPHGELLMIIFEGDLYSYRMSGKACIQGLRYAVSRQTLICSRPTSTGICTPCAARYYDAMCMLMEKDHRVSEEISSRVKL